ncbi:MAG: dihydropteroate synthase [Sulfitobacter sp.]|nr:dihydropteroate synthase [Sulfitobacter sp.]
MNNREYLRPLVQSGPGAPREALRLAGGWGWFTHVEVLVRGRVPQVVRVSDVTPGALDSLLHSREAILGLDFDQPRTMGILNTTPDSFSDGGLHAAAEDAIRAGQEMAVAGADLLDVGGESTRPGAAEVDVEEEISRVRPVLEGLKGAGVVTPLSIDTRKLTVAEAAVTAGARLINDVSGFTFDPALAPFAADAGLPVCVMHSLGDPETMHHDPQYEDVLLDVYDHLEGRIAALEAQGIPRARIIADPGIGFAKTLEHNLTLLGRISLFHSLGVPILLGVSRKRFIGTIGGAEDAQNRMPGSIAVALAGIAQGIQVVRVHDLPQTVQAIALWRAAVAGRQP